MNIQDLTENDLSFVIEIERDGFKVGEVCLPVATNNATVAYLVHEAEEGLLIELIQAPTRH